MSHPIFVASAKNDTFQLQALLQQEPQAVHLRDSRGQTPLHRAAGAGHLEATELLLHHGADPNAQGPCGEAPLHLVDSTALARLLLQHGANPTLEDHDHVTPIDWALLVGRPAGRPAGPP